jgi:hypothetical protein
VKQQHGGRRSRDRAARVPRSAAVEAQLQVLTPSLTEAVIELLADALVQAYQRDARERVASPGGTNQ